MDVMSPHTAELMLQHTAWLRRLAERLVHDPEIAEDVLQDTWVVALEKPPTGSADSVEPGESVERRGSVRAWLGVVLRNVVRKRWRRRSLRERLEAESARVELAPSTDDLFVLQRELMDAVDALAAHEREAVLLRYFEDLPPRKIAARLGVSVKTVNTRLFRALRRLRGRLDERDGDDRRSWVLCFLPFLSGRRRIATALATGTIVMGIKVGLAVVAAGLACFVGWNVLRSGTVESHGSLAPLPARTALDSPADGLSPAGDVGSARDALSTASANEAETVATHLVTGRALLADGNPAAGLAVRFRARREDAARADVVTADAFGGFSLAVDAYGAVHSVAPDFADLIVPNVSERTDSEVVLVVAPNRPLSGVFVDPDGIAIEDVGVRLALPAELHARIGVVFSSNDFGFFATTSDRDGAFRLEPRPVVADAVLEIEHADFEPLVVAPPGDARRDLRFVLVPKTSSSGTLEGVVLDPAGFPVASASVALGDTVTTSDDEGYFHFRLDEVAQPDRLMAVKPGFAPATEHGIETPDGWEWPEFVEIVFTGEPKVIEGIVLDAEGAPVAAASVWIEDPTRLGVRGTFPVHVERELLEQTVLWVCVTTGGDGRFQHGGLMDRAYTLRAGNPRTAELTETVTVRPGEEAVLRFPSGATCVLEGRVVDRAGAPIPGASVSIDRIAHTLEDATGQSYVSQLRGRRAVTGADGSFRLERVPRLGCDLHVYGEGIVGLDLSLSLAEAPEPLELVLSRECHLRIEIETPDLDVDTVVLLDASGMAVTTRRSVRDAIHIAPSAPLPDRQQTLTVPETAVTAVFKKGETEVLRLPITLVPGELTYLRP